MIIFFYLSDDDGATRREARTYGVLPSTRSKTGSQVPDVIELANGVLWSWIRTDLGRQYEMYSVDCGESWTVPDISNFSSPNSPLSMKRIPHPGQLLAVWNPIPNYNTRHIEKGFDGRTLLVAALSSDEGTTWESHFALERQEDPGGFCYTAIHYEEDTAFFAYSAGGPADGNCLARLKIRKVMLEEIWALSKRG